MADKRLQKRALLRGALFAFGVLVFPLSAVTADCRIERYDAAVTVDYVYDGDTVRLKDGRKVRFIGVNTPEINHDGGRSQPYAVAARKRLLELLSGSKKIWLRYGLKRKDHYGRLLAHTYLEDGRSLNVLLLREGLATTLVVPPDTWNHQCYLSVEQQARERKVGIWSLPRYRVTSVAELNQKDKGYRLITATVMKIKTTRRSVWLNLDGPASLRIAKKDLVYFKGWDLQAMKGRTLVARGWLHFEKGRWRMNVRHPSAIELQ